MFLRGINFIFIFKQMPAINVQTYVQLQHIFTYQVYYERYVGMYVVQVYIFVVTVNILLLRCLNCSRYCRIHENVSQ